MPLPMMTPQRKGSSLAKSRPLSLTAAIGGHQGELGEAVEPAGRLGVQDGSGLKFLTSPPKWTLKAVVSNCSIGADAAPAGQQGLPEARHVRAERVDRAHAGDDDAPGHFLA